MDSRIYIGLLFWLYGVLVSIAFASKKGMITFILGVVSFALGMYFLSLL